MSTAVELLRQGRTRELWRKYCGFVDLSIEEFMHIQRRLLLEQLKLLAEMPLGRKIMGGKMPDSVEEFRRTIPLTSYMDYTPYLLEKVTKRYGTQHVCPAEDCEYSEHVEV